MEDWQSNEATRLRRLAANPIPHLFIHFLYLYFWGHFYYNEIIIRENTTLKLRVYELRLPKDILGSIILELIITMKLLHNLLLRNKSPWQPQPNNNPNI